MPDSLKPRFPIRRFDVFADYNRVKEEASGAPEDQAKGYGIWLAKVVAGRRGIPKGEPPGERGTAREQATGAPEERFRSLGGTPQTDRTFDQEIVDRMGREFFDRVFHPAIVQAFADGKRYEDIRDSIRREWKG